MDESIAAQFAPAKGRIYLDAATYGLPPRATVLAVRHALAQWQGGTGRWIEDWDTAAEACRSSFATLIRGSAEDVANQPSVSVAVALIAGSLHRGDEVVVPRDEFTSVLYPLLVAAVERGIRVRQVALEALPDSIGPRTRLVATSLVQMQTGRVAPLDGIIAAAKAHGARVLLDVTQAVPMVAIADHIADIDFLVCAGYKHLLCPRGVAFLYVRPDAASEVWPRNANWRAADPPYDHYFGGPLALPDTAARFDISLAWFSWVGARESLARLVTWQAAGALAAVRDAADRLARSLGAAPTGATLVCLPVADPAGLAKALRSKHIRASMRGGLLRLAPHVWNTEQELQQVATVVRRFLTAVAD